MATYYLINPLQYAATLMWPGSFIDDEQYDVTAIQTAGGVLVDSSVTVVAAAAPKAVAIRARGGAIADAASIMALAFANSGILAPGSVSTVEIADSAVIADKLASDAVETAKILNGAVTAAKLASDAVETAKILNGAVTAAKLADGAGVAALLTAGLGASINVAHDALDPPLLAADAVHARACLVVAVVTDTLTTTAEFSVESVGGVVLLAVPTTTAAGTVLIGAGVVPADVADSAVFVDATAGGAGAISVTILALPTA